MTAPYSCLRRLLPLMLILLSPIAANAYKQIDNLVASLEKNSKVTSEIYSEKRHPKTHRVISSSMLFEFKDEKLAQRFIDAFKKERDKSASFRMTNTPGSRIYSITFLIPEEGKNPEMTAEYTLIEQGPKAWTLRVRKSPTRGGGHIFSSSDTEKLDLDRLSFELKELAQKYRLDPNFDVHLDGQIDLSELQRLKPLK